MAFTPSTTVASIGSLKLTVGRQVGSVTSGTDSWTSTITDIMAIWGQYRTASTNPSDTAFSVSYTQTNGTIWTVIPVSQSGTGFDLFVLSGFYTK